MMTFVLYSDIFGRRPTRANFEEFVGRLDWHDVIVKCSAIALLSWKDGIEERSHQQGLVREFLKLAPKEYASKIADLLQRESHRVLFSRETLLAVLRTALVLQQPQTAQLTDLEATDAFLRMALAANEFLSDELMPDEVTRTARDLLKSEVRSSVLELENPHTLLGRTAAFLAWGRSEEALASDNYLDIEKEFQETIGLTTTEFAAGAYLVQARTVAAKSADELKATGVVFNTDLWLQGDFDSRVPRRWLEVSTVAEAVIRDEWANESSLSFTGVGTLFTRPVIAIEAVNLVSTPMLVTNMMGDGTYFRLFDSFDRAKRERLSRFYWEFFEDYIVAIFQRGYAERKDTKVFPEFFVRPGVKSSDAIVLENGDVIFVEVVKKRLRLVESVLHLDYDAIAADLEAGVMRKLRELHRNITEFRAGTLLPEIERTPGQRIFPVLVAPKAWPRIYAIDELIEPARVKNGLLDGVEPVELLDMGEVESLESAFAGGLSFADLLGRKNRSTRHNRLMTLNNYLIDVEPHTARGRNLALNRGQAAATEVQNLIRSWFPKGEQEKTG